MLPFLAERVRQPGGLAPLRPRRPPRRRRGARRGGRRVVGCRPGEVVFTGCGTESDNLAIVGAVEPPRRRRGVLGGRAPRRAARRSSTTAASSSVSTTRPASISTRSAGALDEPDHVSIVSVMAVNNEVGTITDVAEVGRRAPRMRPSALLHTDAVQGAVLARPARDHAARRPALAQRTQVRRPEGRRRPDRARRHVGRAAAHGRRPGARAAQRHPQRRRHRRHGRGAAAHRCRARQRGDRASPSSATGSSTASQSRLDGVVETVPRDAQGRRLGARLHQRRRERGAAVPARRGRRLRLGRVGVRERGDGAVARPRGDGCRPGGGRWARCGCRSAAPPPRPTSTAPTDVIVAAVEPAAAPVKVRTVVRDAGDAVP